MVLGIIKRVNDCECAMREYSQKHNLKMKKISLLDRFKKEIQFYQVVIKDPRTPKLSKFFLGLAVGYALNPIDLIPDFIPILGYLDDLIIVPGLIFIAVKLIPKKLLQEHKDAN